MQSVANQSFKDFEYIIIDGNSKDKTLEIINNFQSLPENFKGLCEPDSGLYDAMNKGLAMATGEFVWFINAGNAIYSPYTLEKINSEISNLKSQIDIIYGQSLIVNENGKPLGERHKIAPKILTKNSFLNGLVVCHQSILVRREIAQNYNLNYTVSADYDWVLNAFEKSQENLYIDDYLSKFMTSGISAQKRKLSWKERFKIMKNHFGLLKTLFAHILIILKYPFSRKYL
jgi:glycosyltransferase involved in cell wall biosynthesis